MRPYNNSDKEQLIEIFNLNIPEFFDSKELNEYIGYLEIMGDTYLAIEFESKLIGGVGYEIRESDKSGRINWIFVHPDFSGLGHGKRAVEHCLKILKTDPKVESLIIRTSQHAYKFFEKLGYHIINTEKDYWANGLDLYLMEQRI